LRHLRLLRLRLLLRDGKRRYGRGQFNWLRQVDEWWKNGCFPHGRRGGSGWSLKRLASNWCSETACGGELALEIGNLALEGSVLPGIFFGELVQILAQLFILAEQNKGDERGGDHQNCE
jgi:hypothetical protein